MKFIIEETGQVIEPKGRKFYYPPWDKWVEDRYLAKYDPQKLAERFGIYELKEISYDSGFYKATGFTDVKEGNVITRTYTLEPRYTAQQMFNYAVNEIKKEGIRLYAQALRVEPILDLTGDSMDLVVYRQSIRQSFVAARGALATIRDDNTMDDYERYLQFRSFRASWPDVPVDESVWEVYRDNT